MKEKLEFPLRISSRYLLPFKISAYAGVALLISGGVWFLFVTPPDDGLTTIAFFIGWGNIIIILILALVRFKRYRDVVWNIDHLIVKDKIDIIIPLNEIREIELKALNGVHKVHLLEEHPYLGESFFFLGSLNYFFRNKKVDFIMQELSECIVRAKREMV